MKKKTNLTYNDLVNEVSKLSRNDMRKLITAYLKDNGGNMDKRYERLVLLDLEEKIKDLNTNTTCPKCGSTLIVNNGKRDSGIQRLKCTDCNYRFTYFTGTILEKTKYHWDMWVDLIYYMIHDMSLVDIRNNLIQNNNCLSLTEATIVN